MQQKLGEREFSGCVQSWQVQPVDGRRGDEEVTFSTAARRRPKVDHVSNLKIFLCCSAELIWKMVLVWHFGGKRLAWSRSKKSSPAASNDELKSRAVLEVASVASCNTIQQDGSGVECIHLIEGLAEDRILLNYFLVINLTKPSVWGVTVLDRYMVNKAFHATSHNHNHSVNRLSRGTQEHLVNITNFPKNAEISFQIDAYMCTHTRLSDLYEGQRFTVTY